MTSRLLRLLTLVVAVATIGLVGGVSPSIVSAEPPDRGNEETVQVRGTGPNGEKFNGRFTAQSAKEGPGGERPLAVTGQLTGKLVSPGQGQETAQDVNQTVDMPALIQQATCEVLTLVLGPLDLNLLGLMVHLDQVVLEITADPSGGLLGQLLCSLAGGLPAPPNPLQPIIDLLNQILGLLGG
ncbi:hypothetical protein H7J87_32205 [Mycolicibacterium wolinskyi]|uniref:Uncharacterized protein n=1 Tax=Mycolicibacterium wolinskyi TaxID=59750 RepID=A0A1X2EWJ6_9MYCO|nr:MULTISPECIES: hypothetical protein [Mycolicibacterium]MCV7289998.1 hypothetical protein [Mycolicibacterium wolinskyi]MCV7293033.1 hypothetical protein [Mycolicibacterium goodii]ORX10640.1 hypothetical protein AWC31_04970 [Mycolicibacterium wolinskyi]